MSVTRGDKFEVQLYGFAGRILKKLRIKNASVDIILLRGRDLALLKKRFGLHKPGKTPDVLAFQEPMRFPHPELRGKRLLGEVYLNQDLDLERLGFLLVHGILHLIGLSHEQKDDILKMERLEQELFRSIFRKSLNELEIHHRPRHWNTHPEGRRRRKR
jgi:ssRNA-specific RNase YbeY (16S rRNA maturation enzyme)